MTLSQVTRTVSKPVGLFVAVLGFAFCAFALPASSASAATCTFNNTTSDFNTDTNWDCGHVPTVGDDAVIQTGQTAVMSQAASMDNVTVQSNSTLTTIGFDLQVAHKLDNVGILNAGGNTISVGSDFVNPGSFIAGDGTFRFVGTEATHASSAFFNNLEVAKDNGGGANVPFVLDTDITVLGNFTASGDTGFAFNNMMLKVAGNVTFMPEVDITLDGTVLLNGTGDQTVTGVQASALTVNKASGSAMLAAGTTVRVNLLQVNQGTFDMTNAALVEVGIFNGNGTPFILSGGTFVGGTEGQFSYYGGNDVNVAAAVYPNLHFSPVGTATYTLTGQTIVNGDLRVGPGATLAVSNNILESNGAYVNLGLVTEGPGGWIMHPTDEFTFVRVGETIDPETDFTTPDQVYIQLWDPNQNFDGTNVETITVPVALDAIAGGDTDMVTLTETGPATGIFRSAAMPLVVASIVIPSNNGQFEISATGLATSSYEDPQDEDDTPTATATFHYFTFPTQGGGGEGGNGGNGGNGGGGGGGSSGGSGGGGLGAPEVQALPPVVTHYESSQSGSGSTPTGNVAGTSTTDTFQGSLIKLLDDGNINTQPDTTVYYIGKDGKRHAFTNEKVYFTWYHDYSQVQIVSESELNAIPQGANMTYKPGVKMTKFETSDKVYTVSKGAVLNWVKSEEVAAGLYGSEWKSKVDDIPAAFSSDYSFGPDITSVLDYSPSTAMTIVDSPEKNWSV